MKHTTLLLPLFFVFVLIGCGKRPPEGLPPLVSCKVKVRDGDRPLADIGVSFQRVEGHGSWSLNGQTDSSGVAIAQTSVGTYQAAGIPAGSYRITLIERIDLPPEFNNDTDPTIPEKVRKYLAEHRKLPAILSDPTKSPLEFTVSEPKAELDIDVAQYK